MCSADRAVGDPEQVEPGSEPRRGAKTGDGQDIDPDVRERETENDSSADFADFFRGITEANLRNR
jgi:hypothetical protein